jgi:hypothetical protein
MFMYMLGFAYSYMRDTYVCMHTGLYVFPRSSSAEIAEVQIEAKSKTSMLFLDQHLLFSPMLTFVFGLIF